MKSLALLFIGAMIGLVASTHFSQRKVACMFQSWGEPSPVCSESYPDRGDRMVLLNPHPFYKGCEITYLAGQATSNRNEVWVLLQKCDNPSLQGTTTDIFDRTDLVKVVK